jgi:hypothetical protein
MVSGSPDTDDVAALSVKLDLAGRGQLLASKSSDELRVELQRALGAARFLNEDATGVLVGADASARYQSGIL